MKIDYYYIISLVKFGPLTLDEDKYIKVLHRINISFVTISNSKWIGGWIWIYVNKIFDKKQNFSKPLIRWYLSGDIIRNLLMKSQGKYFVLINRTTVIKEGRGRLKTIDTTNRNIKTYYLNNDKEQGITSQSRILRDINRMEDSVSDVVLRRRKWRCNFVKINFTPTGWFMIIRVFLNNDLH